MDKQYRILVINPKSTTTLLSFFLNEVCVFKQSVNHESVEQQTLVTDTNLRKKHILHMLEETSINFSKIDAICTNGGIIRPVTGGTYTINEAMVRDLKNNYNGKHASNLGGIIAHEIAKGLNIPAYIVDPPVVDELSELARYSGFPKLKRKSIFHALNQKYVARKAAEELSYPYDEVNFIVAHLGYGITIGAHEKGKVIDVNNGLHGDGPFSLERAGTIPLEGLISLAFSGDYTKESLLNDITYHSGLKGYLHTKSLTEIEEGISLNDVHAKTVFHAMAYQIVKEIGAMATVLKGQVDGIILTGFLAESNLLVDLLSPKIAWIADVFIYPGEFDVQALNDGALRVLRGLEKAKEYEEIKEVDDHVKRV